MENPDDIDVRTGLLSDETAAGGPSPVTPVSPPSTTPIGTVAPPTTVTSVTTACSGHEVATGQYSVVQSQASRPCPPTGYNCDQTDGPGGGQADNGLAETALLVISWFLIIITLPFSLLVCIKVVQEYERAVIFRLGRLCKGGAKGPGLFFIYPCMDNYIKIDMRTVSFDVPPQEILTKDSVTVAVDAVVYFRVFNPTIAVTNVEDANRSTRLLAQTTLRNVLGTQNLHDLLVQREEIARCMQSSLDDATDPWGIQVERVEIKDVRLPLLLQRAMAAEAEATREAKAKVIAAEGEQRAAKALKEAAEVISSTPAALQLRYLQTLSTISAEKNSTIIFPIPVDIVGALLDRKQ